MKTPVSDTYKVAFLIIQNHERRGDDHFEKEASQIFTEFIKDKSYGKGIKAFGFYIHIEPEVNYGSLRDGIDSSRLAHLSAHVNKHYFDNSNKDLKLKLLLTSSYVLIKFLKQRVVLPKGFDAERLERDYYEYLSDKGYLLNQEIIDLSIVKIFDTTCFDFIITTTSEVKKEKIHYDLNDLEEFINNRLAGKTFGESVRNFQIGYEIFDFNGQFASFYKMSENLMKYGAKYKRLLFVKQINYPSIEKLDGKEQYQILKTKILEAILDIEKLPKKPKDFNRVEFYNFMKEVLEDYAKKR